MNVAQQAENPHTGNTTQQTLPFEPRGAAYLQERAVDLAQATEAGLRSVSAGEGATLLGFDEPLSTGGLFIPYANAAGYARIRLSEGKTRFLVPRGREVPIYVPPGCELEGSAPIHVTEGPIKALALQQHGFNTIGLGGITTTLTKTNHELNDSWNVVALPRRDVVIVFDARRVMNPDVARAEARLALAIERRGAKVNVAALPLREDGGDQGPDDFIAAHGDAELRQVLAAAVPASPIECLKAISVNFNTAEERVQAAMSLLGDFPFLASIHVRGISVEKQVLALLAKYKITPRDLGRAMKEMEGQAKKHAPEPVVDSSGSPYVIHNGQWCFVSRLGDMVRHEPICNFTARILHEEVRDDGLEQERVFTVTGTIIGGEPLRPVTLTAAQFNDELWPMKKWGAAAIVLPVRYAANHLRAAIQQQQPAPPSVTTYTHTGLRKHDGCWTFLHADGAVGAEDVTVHLDEDLARYKLPETTDDLVEAVRLSLGTLRVADARITAVLHASMYRAPLQELDYCDAAVAVHGPSGSLKSAMTALFLSHYGDFEHDNLPLNWSATENAIEAHLHKMKDMPVVIDDFVPKSSDPGDEFHKKAMRVLRSTGNGTGRQRLNRDLSLRPSRRPRALVIMTGEQLPEGGSIRARLVTIRMRREDVDLVQLSRLQQARRRLPHALRGYIEWLLPRLESIRAEMTEIHAKYWASLQQEGGAHLRAPTAMAHLLVGAHYFAEFAVSIGAIDEAGADDYLRTVREALVANNREQSRLATEMKPTRRFLDVVKGLLLQGRVGLVPMALPLTTTTKDDSTINVGWEDDKLVYLMPDAAYAVFMQALRAMNENMPLGQSALWSQLQDEGLAARGDGKNLLPKRRLGGARPRVVELERRVLREPSDIEERIAAEVGGGAPSPDDDDDDPGGGPEGEGPAGGAPPFVPGGSRPGPLPEAPRRAGGSLAALPVALRLPHPALLALPWPDRGPTEEAEHSPSNSVTYEERPYWPYLPEDRGRVQRVPSRPDQGGDPNTPSVGVSYPSGTVGPVGPLHATAGSETGIATRSSRATSGQQSGQGVAPFATFAQAARQAGRVGMAVRYTGSADRDPRAVLALAAPGGMTCTVDPAEFNTREPLAELLCEVTIVGHDIKTPLVHLAQYSGMEPKAVIDTLLLWKLRDFGEHLDDPKHFDFDRARAEAGCSSNDNARAVRAARLDQQHALEQARDVLLVAERLKAELRECELEEVAELEMRLLPVVVEMERVGVPINRSEWAAVVDDWEAEATTIERRFAAAGGNIRNDRDVRAALHAQGIVVPRTGGEVLAPYAHVPLVQDLVRYRSLYGFVAGPGKEVLRALDKNGRVHGSWNQLGATGRMSCSRPNLLGLPRDRRVRGCIQAPPGKKLIIGDYNTIELRVLAEHVGDEAFTEVFRRGGDPHRETAMRLLGVDPARITEEERKRAKSINFGMMNGMGAASLVSYALENYNVVMSLERAEEYKRKFLDLYGGIARWHDYIKNNELDALRSASGRLRYFSDSRNNYNAKLCTPIQATAADGMKYAMVLLYPHLKRLGAKLILAVHDELLIEAPEEHANAVMELMREHMIAGMQMYVLSVPIVVEPEVRSSWGK